MSFRVRFYKEGDQRTLGADWWRSSDCWGRSDPTDPPSVVVFPNADLQAKTAALLVKELARAGMVCTGMDEAGFDVYEKMATGAPKPKRKRRPCPRCGFAGEGAA